MIAYPALFEYERRITKIFGKIGDEELEKIDEGLRLFLGLR